VGDDINFFTKINFKKKLSTPIKKFKNNDFLEQTLNIL
jgi:hypothetical protein